VKPTLHVAILADASDTVDGLSAYLERAGVVAHATRSLAGGSALPESITAVVIFPDDLRAADVSATITGLRAARPELLILLVTRMPQRFREATGSDGGAPAAIVLPRPAFGWVILDAIRSHALREPA
jgi:hypothetical protein